MDGRIIPPSNTPAHQGKRRRTVALIRCSTISMWSLRPRCSGPRTEKGRMTQLHTTGLRADERPTADFDPTDFASDAAGERSRR